MTQRATHPTPRQLESLRLYGQGDSVAQVAHKMGVSVSTVEKTHARVRVILGARTLTHAVYIAAKSGLIILALHAGLSDDVDMLRRGSRRTRRQDEISLPLSDA